MKLNAEHSHSTVLLRGTDSATNPAPGTVPNPGGAITAAGEVTRLTRMQTCSIVIRLQPYGALGDRLLNMGDDSRSPDARTGAGWYWVSAPNYYLLLYVIVIYYLYE